MNRLAPLVVRPPRTPIAAAPMQPARTAFMSAEAAPSGSDGLRLFASSYLAGLVFFGTYLA